MTGPETAVAPPPPPPAGPGSSSAPIRLVLHSRHCLRLRWRLARLQALLDAATFWARRRSPSELRRMLSGSQAVVSAWQGPELVGFGRATSDGVFRAVLWDVVVAPSHQAQGLGRRLVEALVQSPAVSRVERVYLMTTNSAGFYARLGFHEGHGQRLMVRQASCRGPFTAEGHDPHLSAPLRFDAPQDLAHELQVGSPSVPAPRTDASEAPAQGSPAGPAAPLV